MAESITSQAHDSEGGGSAERVVGRRLFDARTIVLMDDISPETARRVVGQLLAMSYESDSAIRLFISSPGGHVESGDAIHDTIRFVRAPVHIIGSGWVASAGAHIYLAAEKTHRFCLPNTRFMLHQPSGGVRGQSSDIEIEVNEIVKMRERLNRIIAERTGQPLERVVKDTDRNHWMNPAEALEYGLVGRIIERVDQLPR